MSTPQLAAATCRQVARTRKHRAREKLRCRGIDDVAIRCRVVVVVVGFVVVHVLNAITVAEKIVVATVLPRH